MRRRDFIAISLLAPLAMARGAWAGPAVEAVPDGRPHRFGFGPRRFELDGKPFRIRSGEMHPARIPREYWRHRIRMAKAMGLNTIALYVMWNHHEREPGVFDWQSDNRDMAAFIRLCQAEGLWVYLRPGPYVCAEWTNGGLPAYLLRDPDIRLRTKDDPSFMAATLRYIRQLAGFVKPLMVENGGPVLMIQVENEYSMFGDDVDYLRALAEMWRVHGIQGPFAVSDGLKDLKRRKAYLPGAALGLDGADVGDLEAGPRFAGESPVWVGEGYPGWLTHWGESEFASRHYVDTLRSVIRAGYSFNLYVVHGGTNFGLTAGTNAEDDGSQFQPAITSYDYAAPIDERGRASGAYKALRDAITQEAAVKAPAPPDDMPAGHFAPFTPTPKASLWDALGAARRLPLPGPNEVLFGQDQGLVVYRKRVDATGTLHLGGARDYAVVYADGREVGHVSRLAHPALSSSPDVAIPHAGTVEVLVDTFGHINFGPRLGDHKGLVGPVAFNGELMRDVEAFPLPLDGPWLESAPALQGTPTRGGVIFEGTLTLDRPGDVYLDMGAWNKGYLWVNGKLLGRYWHIGPQERLYCPGVWLKAGANTVRVLDLHRTDGAPITCAERMHDGMA
ncbi:beta-galactosidase [Luteibacter yeojuensis]|nr:beta-galactosidase [Luteibacter yeojuensis]